ncbi:MAG: topoisomerase DNA-binding C4 zinc finger domain-containing protein, partial [Clostridiales bacterium]|nr:topoisomerase DNA-binding C4 zinc finger domain-containing protein [Clostridiales bacterium]
VVTQLMEDKFTDIVDPNFTARMESDLDEVEKGREDWKELLRRFYAGFHAEMEQAEKDLDGERIKIPDEVSDEVCEVCGRQMVIKTGKFGRFLACPGYPECTFTKPIVIEMPGKCPKCGGRILKKTSRNGYTYYGCEHNRSVNGMVCDFMTWDVPVKENCPICGQTMFKKSGRGAKKPFCINEKCENFTPEELRPGYRKPKEKTEDAVSQAAAEAIAEPSAEKTADKKTAAKKSTTAKKSAAKKSTAKRATTTKPAAKKAPAKKSAAKKDPNKPKRQLTEAQRAALEKGWAIQAAKREAAKQQKSEE